MRTLNEMEVIAKEKGWKLNPNPKIVSALIQSENKLKEKYGEFYCPCKIERTAENICPCAEAQNEINQTGHCHCNLFHK